MHRHVTLGCLLLVSLALVCGCSSQPKDPFLQWGAAQKYRDFVPETARTVAKGTGKLTFTATEPGTLYLLDLGTWDNIDGVLKPRAIGSGLIAKGAKVIFDPVAGRVYREGHEGIGLTGINSGHTFELRFDPTEKK